MKTKFIIKATKPEFSGFVEIQTGYGLEAYITSGRDYATRFDTEAAAEKSLGWIGDYLGQPTTLEIVPEQSPEVDVDAIYAESKKRRHVFLYGIFLESHCEKNLLDLGCQPCRAAMLHDYKLKSAGVMSVAPEKGRKVYGMLWEVSDKGADYLDMIEGVKRGFYGRAPIKDVDGLKPAWVYVMRRLPERSVAHDNNKRAQKSAKRLGVLQNGMGEFRPEVA